MLHFTPAAAAFAPRDGLKTCKGAIVNRPARQSIYGKAMSMRPVSAADGAVAGGHDGSRPLRGWQRRALVKYLAGQPRDFVAVATPGSGKTTFALRVAAELLSHRAVEQITVVLPTEHLKVQWAQAAGRHGLT